MGVGKGPWSGIAAYLPAGMGEPFPASFPLQGLRRWYVHLLRYATHHHHVSTDYGDMARTLAVRFGQIGGGEYLPPPR